MWCRRMYVRRQNVCSQPSHFGEYPISDPERISGNLGPDLLLLLSDIAQESHRDHEFSAKPVRLYKIQDCAKWLFAATALYFGSKDAAFNAAAKQKGPPMAGLLSSSFACDQDAARSCACLRRSSRIPLIRERRFSTFCDASCAVART